MQLIRLIETTASSVIFREYMDLKIVRFSINYILSFILLYLYFLPPSNPVTESESNLLVDAVTETTSTASDLISEREVFFIFIALY